MAEADAQRGESTGEEADAQRARRINPGSGSMTRAITRATSGGVKNSPADWPLPSANLRIGHSCGRRPEQARWARRV
jgi:hypothetical protein